LILSKESISPVVFERKEKFDTRDTLSFLPHLRTTFWIDSSHMTSSKMFLLSCANPASCPLIPHALVSLHTFFYQLFLLQLCLTYCYSLPHTLTHSLATTHTMAKFQESGAHQTLYASMSLDTQHPLTENHPANYLENSC
jgi:hypothetical protein